MDIGHRIDDIKLKIEQLATALEQLREENKALQTENNQLKEKLGQQKEVTGEIKYKLESNEQVIENLRKEGPERVKQLRNQIEQYLGEIDQCVEWLQNS